MFTRCFHPPGRSYFLFGPRGTGKTHWLHQHYDEQMEFYDLLDATTYLRLSRQPGAFREEVAAVDAQRLVVVDEVQKLPRLLDDCHHFLAQPGNRRRFVLTGSSARKLRRTSANLLAGRVSQRYFYPLVAAEHGRLRTVGELGDVDAILRFGTLPEVLNLSVQRDKIEFLEAYAVTYLREEIQQEAAAKNIDSFSRFLEVAAIANGQVTNLASLSRDAGVARTTLAGYFQALEDTLIGVWLRAWRPRLRIKETQHPKFFLFDPGVARVLAGNARQPLGSEERGHLLETYLLHELRAWNDFNDWGANLTFWRSPAKAEVDFVVELPGSARRVGIEVKAKSEWKSEYGKHLKILHADGTFERIIGVYLGERRRRSGSLDVVPLPTFLKLLERDELFA